MNLARRRVAAAAALTVAFGTLVVVAGPASAASITVSVAGSPAPVASNADAAIPVTLSGLSVRSTTHDTATLILGDVARVESTVDPSSTAGSDSITFDMDLRGLPVGNYGVQVNPGGSSQLAQDRCSLCLQITAPAPNLTALAYDGAVRTSVAKGVTYDTPADNSNPLQPVPEMGSIHLLGTNLVNNPSAVYFTSADGTTKLAQLAWAQSSNDASSSSPTDVRGRLAWTGDLSTFDTSVTYRLVMVNGGGGTSSIPITVDPLPTVSSVTRSIGGLVLSAPHQATNTKVPVTINGTGFLPGARVAFANTKTGDPAITATVDSLASTTIGATVTVPSGYPVGDAASLVVVNPDRGSGSLAQPYTVTGADPVVSAVNPSNLGRGAVQSLTIDGSSFRSGCYGQTVPLPGCAGGTSVPPAVSFADPDAVQVTGTVVMNSAGTQLTVPVTVAAGANLGANAPIVTDADVLDSSHVPDPSKSAVGSCVAACFAVTTYQITTINSSPPPVGVQNDAAPKDFAIATSATGTSLPAPGSGIAYSGSFTRSRPLPDGTVETIPLAVTWIDAHHLTATGSFVHAAAGAYDLSISDGQGGVAALGGAVVLAGEYPTITSVAPAAVVPVDGATRSVAVTGSGFQDGLRARVTRGSTTLATSVAAITSATTATLSVTVPRTAGTGAYDITLINPDQNADETYSQTKTGALTIAPDPKLATTVPSPLAVAAPPQTVTFAIDNSAPGATDLADRAITLHLSGIGVTPAQVQAAQNGVAPVVSGSAGNVTVTVPIGGIPAGQKVTKTMTLGLAPGSPTGNLVVDSTLGPTAGGTEATDSDTVKVIPAATVPGPVRDLSIRPGQTSVSVAFNPPATDGGSPIIDYTGALTAAGSSTPNVVTSATNGLTFNGLSPRTSYTLSIRARNQVGSGLAVSANVQTLGAAPSLTAHLSALHIGARKTVKLSGVLTGGIQGGGDTISITVTPRAGKTSTVRALTNAGGAYSLTLAPNVDTCYRAAAPGVVAPKVCVTVEARIINLRTSRAGRLLTVKAVIVPGSHLTSSTRFLVALDVLSRKGRIVQRLKTVRPGQKRAAAGFPAGVNPVSLTVTAPAHGTRLRLDILVSPQNTRGSSKIFAV